MPKRIIVLFDGTWNKPGEHGDESDVETNVCRLYESLLEKSEQDGLEQVAWYDRGVGTNWYDRLRGGAFGRGIDRNIKQGYAFLSLHYEEGDELFVFGFSRGAYTARSLVGLIRNCGLIHNRHVRIPNSDKQSPEAVDDLLNDLAKEGPIDEAYGIYRSRDEGPDDGASVAFRERWSRMPKIKLLGVWDTVGALGIPLQLLSDLNERKYQFHDTELSGIVENAYHAVAIDEHRADYDVTLWDSQPKPDQHIEQRWFIGAHADVGGGYEDRRLSDITLHWMQSKARESGLGVEPKKMPAIGPSNFGASPTDSYKKFLHGLYSLRRPRYYRPIGRTGYGNETLDDSVAQRLKAGGDYSPRNSGFQEMLAKITGTHDSAS